MVSIRSWRKSLSRVLASIVSTGFTGRCVQADLHSDAGMTTEERELIAQAYDLNVLKVVVATCSLAAGVNLPARRVIINGARMGRELVGPALLYALRCVV